MNYVFTVRRKARADIQLIYDWYESESPGLGEEFLEDLDDAFSRIRQFPSMYALVLPRVRRSYTRRFPFSIFYFFENDKIVILNCRHMHQHPDSWPKV